MAGKGKSEDGAKKSGAARGRKYLFVLIATIIFLAGIEGVFRIIGSAGAGTEDPSKLDIRGNMNDFIGSLEIFVNMHDLEGGKSLYVEDPKYLWKLRPGFRGKARDFFTAGLTENAPEWTFSINRSGFRGQDFLPARDPGVYRIVALGDSTTFGFGVDPGDSYSERLGSLLEEICPSCRFEVINLGVPGYSSEQGLLLAKEWIPVLAPQAVIIAYGTNDWWPRSRSDEDEMLRQKTFMAKLGRIARMSAAARGIEKMLAKPPPPPSRGKGSGKEVNRVGAAGYEKNVEEIAAIASDAGAKVVLLDDNFYVSFGSRQLADIAQRHPDYILVDAVGVLAASLAHPDLIIKKYPVSSETAMRIYSKEINKRPLFLLMVDPVHPNAVGHEIIAEALAKAIIERGNVVESVAEKMRYNRTLPRMDSYGGGFLDFTELERRTAELTKKDE